MIAPILCGERPGQESHRPIAKVAGILGIKGDRIGRAEFVAEILVDEVDFHSEPPQPFAEVILDHPAEFDFAQAEVAVRVALDVAVLPEPVLGAQCAEQAFLTDRLEQPLGQDGNSVFLASYLVLEDRTDHHVRNGVESDLLTAELFGDDGNRRRRGLADAQGEMPRRSTHTNNDVPPTGGPGIGEQGARRKHAEVAGGLEAEGGCPLGERQVVVDGLGDVGDAERGDAVFQVGAGADPLGDLTGRKGGIVAANGHQGVDLHLAQDPEDVGHVLFLLGGVGPRGAEDGASAKIKDGDFIDGQFPIVAHTAFDEVLEAVLEPDDFHAIVLDGLDGHGRDDAIDTGRGAASDEDAEPTALEGIIHCVVESVGPAPR